MDIPQSGCNLYLKEGVYISAKDILVCPTTRSKTRHPMSKTKCTAIRAVNRAKSPLSSPVRPEIFGPSFEQAELRARPELLIKPKQILGRSWAFVARLKVGSKPD